jgi:predicted dienelactone hydrolase
LDGSPSAGGTAAEAGGATSAAARMRPLETLLVTANLAAFGLALLRLPGRARWLRHAALLPMLAAVAQALVGGARWQMVPAYALAGLSLLLWLASLRQAPERRAAGGWSRRLAAGVAVGLGTVVVATSIALPVALPVFRFPNPSGPYGIGTVTDHWVDSTRQEIFSADPRAHRELMAQVWYPARVRPSSPRAPYVRDAAALSPALARLVHAPPFTFDHFRYVTTHAVASAPMATDEPRYPVLIFLEGLNGYRQMNTFQVENLVSHGYVVVAIDQPYVAGSVVFPDGRQTTGWTKDRLQPLFQQSLSPGPNPPTLNGHPLENGIVPYWARDVSFALDRIADLDHRDPHEILSGRLDQQRIGIFGMSLGALVAGEACRTDSRLRACLMMDAFMPADVVRDGLRQPSMWITRDAGSMRLERERAGGWPEAEIHETLTTMRATFARSAPGSGYYVEVPGTFHANFTDVPLFTPLAQQLGLAGPIDPGRAHDIVNACSLAFFDRSLKGRPAGLLDGPSKSYPDVRLETR